MKHNISIILGSDVYDVTYDPPVIVRILRTFNDSGRIRNYQFRDLPNSVKQILQNRLNQLEEMKPRPPYEVEVYTDDGEPITLYVDENCARCETIDGVVYDMNDDQKDAALYQVNEKKGYV